MQHSTTRERAKERLARAICDLSIVRRGVPKPGLAWAHDETEWHAPEASMEAARQCADELLDVLGLIAVDPKVIEEVRRARRRYDAARATDRLNEDALIESCRDAEESLADAVLAGGSK